MRQSRKRAAVVAAATAVLAACAIAAAPARAAFVDALGSPFPTAAPTRALDVADLTGDGVPDVVAGGLTLHRGFGSGGLAGPTPIGHPGAVLALAGGDLDRDGGRDYAVVAPGAPRRVLTYTRTPAGGYAEGTALADAGAATAVAIGDLDGNGTADLAVGRTGGGDDVTALLANGAGGYVASDAESGLPAVADLVAADLDRDGRAELVAAGGAAELATLQLGGDGELADGVAVPTGAAGTVERLATLDLDGNGIADLVGTDGGGASAVVLLLGDGAGGLAALGRRGTGLPAPPSAVAAGDVNGDGRVDVVAGSGGGVMAALLGDGGGGLAPAPGSPFPAGAADPAALAVADMNRDAQPDVVVAHRGGAIAVRLNSDTGRIEAVPGLVDFGDMPAGTLAQTATVTFRSVRGRVAITRTDMHGPGRFAVAGGDCVGRTLLVGQTCLVHVSYTPPRDAGDERGLLSLDATAAAVVVPIEGTVRPPLVGEATVRPRRVRPARRLAVHHTLSEPARVRVLVERGLPGRRIGRGAGRRCVPLNRRNRKRKRCRAWTQVARVARPGVAGDNVVRLPARGRAVRTDRERSRDRAEARRRRALARRRARASARRPPLEPGVYRVGVSAADRFRNRSDEVTAKFRVVERRRGRGRRRGRDDRDSRRRDAGGDSSRRR